MKALLSELFARSEALRRKADRLTEAAEKLYDRISRLNMKAQDLLALRPHGRAVLPSRSECREKLCLKGAGEMLCRGEGTAMGAKPTLCGRKRNGGFGGSERRKMVYRGGCA